VEDAVPIADPNAQIYRCTWEDLAIITLSPEHAGQYTEFFDIGREWIDPPEGHVVHCCGYPRDRGAFLEKRNVGDKEEHSIGISPYLFDGQVLPSPTEDELKFKITSFNLERHYLMPFKDAEDGRHPGGYSGAATWWENPTEGLVWTPRFKFAGICSCCYEKGSKEQVIKASVVRRFLHEVFGPLFDTKDQ
jgi:hypothetical protein